MEFPTVAPLRFRTVFGALASILFTVSATIAIAAPHLPSPGFATSRVAEPEVIVSPDRTDWTYGLGDEVHFTVRVLSDGQPIEGATVDYQLGPERFEQPFRDVPVPSAGLKIKAGTLQAPGFLRCLATFKLNGETYRGLATAAFAPDQLQPTQADPADFDAFWSDHLAQLQDVPIRLLKTPVPEACTPEVKVSHVRFESWNFGGRTMPFYGVLTEPAKPGKYPAVLRVPGAGVRPYFGEIEMARRGFVVLQIGIHGIPIDLPQPLYDNLRYGALNYYPAFNLDDRESYYYLRVYLACVRANDVLTAQESWDGETLLVTGGSQGGQLTIVTSALDPRVDGSVANYPANCDVTGYLHDRAGGWPHLLAKPEHQTEAKIRTTAYFDTVNFARRLHAPISLGWGYNDEVCPPTSMFSAYNVIPSPKQLHLQFDMGHHSSAAFAAHYLDRLTAMAQRVAR